MYIRETKRMCVYIIYIIYWTTYLKNKNTKKENEDGILVHYIRYNTNTIMSFPENKTKNNVSSDDH